MPQKWEGETCFISGQHRLKAELKEGNLEVREVLVSENPSWRDVGDVARPYGGPLPGEFGMSFPWIFGEELPWGHWQRIRQDKWEPETGEGPGRDRQSRAGTGRAGQVRGSARRSGASSQVPTPWEILQGMGCIKRTSSTGDLCLFALFVKQRFLVPHANGKRRQRIILNHQVNGQIRV